MTNSTVKILLQEVSGLFFLQRVLLLSNCTNIYNSTLEIDYPCGIIEQTLYLETVVLPSCENSPAIINILALSLGVGISAITVLIVIVAVVVIKHRQKQTIAKIAELGVIAAAAY